MCLEAVWLCRCSSLLSCKAVSREAPSHVAGVPGLAPSPPPPSGAHPPACVGRPQAAEDEPVPPFVEPAPAPPAPPAQPSVSLAPAASGPGEQEGKM